MRMSLMSKAAVVTLAGLMAAVPAFAETIKVRVGEDRIVEIKDLRLQAPVGASVCSLKVKVAKALDMDMKDFDLVDNGVKLDRARSLEDHGIRNLSTLDIRAAENSKQC
ncbi:MAG: hypothetical protein EP335_08290 [Alphaproteobacteria bacterium]|nr:MAG: hypothetical protein EP335_08290 [Alphaproteobacteria bacterium]